MSLRRVTIMIEPIDGRGPVRKWTLECYETEVAFLSDQPVRSLLDDPGMSISSRDHAEFTFKWFRNMRAEDSTAVPSPEPAKFSFYEVPKP